MTTEAFVYDAVRTPRGRGKQNGSLHETKPVSLLVGLIDELRKRNPDARSRPHRGRHPRRRLAGRRPGRGHRAHRRSRRRSGEVRSGLPAQPVLRLRPRGGEHRGAEGALRLGGPAPRRRRRVDVAGADGLRRRRVGTWTRDRVRHRLRPAGHQRRPDRHDRGLQPRRRRPVRRRVADARRQGDRRRRVQPTR